MTEPLPKPTIKDCPRCTVDHYSVIPWRRLTRPVKGPTYTYTHWAPCPTNHDPVLARLEPFLAA